MPFGAFLGKPEVGHIPAVIEQGNALGANLGRQARCLLEERQHETTLAVQVRPLATVKIRVVQNRIIHQPAHEADADLPVLAVFRVRHRLLDNRRETFREISRGNRGRTAPDREHGGEDRPVDGVEHIAAVILEVVILVALNPPQHAGFQQEPDDLNQIAPFIHGFQFER